MIAFTGRWILRGVLLLAVVLAIGLALRIHDVESGPPLVYASIKEVAREAEAMSFQDAMNWITKRKFRTVDELYASDDNMEGFRAFAEKRDPNWSAK